MDGLLRRELPPGVTLLLPPIMVPGGVAEFWRALAALSNNAADRERRLRFCREAEVAYGSGS